MKTVLSILALLFILTSQGFAEEGVHKVKKSKLKIDKLGTVTSETDEVITANVKASKSKNKGKWKGIGGKIFGKFYPKGADEIINVSENEIHKINRKKKKCETRPLVTEESKEAQKSLKGVFQQILREYCLGIGAIKSCLCLVHVGNCYQTDLEAFLSLLELSCDCGTFRMGKFDIVLRGKNIKIGFGNPQDQALTGFLQICQLSDACRFGGFDGRQQFGIV